MKTTFHQVGSLLDFQPDEKMNLRPLSLFMMVMLVTLWVPLKAVEKYEVFVFTDINLVGGDPDDRQSFIHLLWYADELDIKGIVPDRWKGKGYEACIDGLKPYEKDYHAYGFKRKGYPHPDEIKKKIAKSEEEAISSLRWAATQGKSVLYVLVWGNMQTVKKALFKYPEIADKIRVLSIGTGRKYGPKDEVPGRDCNVVNWNGPGRNEIFEDARFHRMWWLESNWTYNGMFMGEGPKIMFEKLSRHGAMGKHIKTVTQDHDWAQYFRVGDTPTVLYLIDRDHPVDHPEIGGWAGLFKKPFPELRSNYYTDDNGTIEWDYHDPCQTWHNLTEMYAYNKQTLVRQREEMYEELLRKLALLYDQ